MSRDMFDGDDGTLVKKEIIDGLKDSFFSAEEKAPEIAEVTIHDVVGQQQQTTIEQLLLQQAEELEIELSEINLDDPQEQRELFECFEIETNLSKKTKLRKLIRELQSKPAASEKKLQSEEPILTEITATVAMSPPVVPLPENMILPTVALSYDRQIASYREAAKQKNSSIADEPATTANIKIVSSEDSVAPVDPAVTDVVQDEYLLVNIVGFLPVTKIIATKTVATCWSKAGTAAIDDRCRGQKVAFTSHKQLEDQISTYMEFHPGDVETMARTVGYPMNRWDVSQVTNFENLFAWQIYFNEDIGDWDVGKAASMSGMFRSAARFNKSLEKWNVANVINFSNMFEGAESFEGRGVERWNVARAHDTSGMFQFCRVFDADLRNWNVSNVKNMGTMFHGASIFWGRGLEHWTVDQVENMQMMFSGTHKFNADIRQWNISNVVNTIMMFQSAQAFDRDVRHWKFHPKVNAGMMFSDASSFPREYTPRKEGDCLSEYHISYKHAFQCF